MTINIEAILEDMGWLSKQPSTLKKGRYTIILDADFTCQLEQGDDGDYNVLRTDVFVYLLINKYGRDPEIYIKNGRIASYLAFEKLWNISGDVYQDIADVDIVLEEYSTLSDKIEPKDYVTTVLAWAMNRNNAKPNWRWLKSALDTAKKED